MNEKELPAPRIAMPTPRQWLFAAALVALPLLIHAPFLLGLLTIDPLPYVGHAGEVADAWKGGRPFIDPNAGWQAQALGKLAADLWLSGQVPWWNSYNGAGLPLAAEAQPGALFLPFVLLYHFRLGIVWVAALLQIIAGLSTYALLRKIRLTPLAAFAGAVLYEFNGTFAWHGAPIITPIAFLPLLLLAIEHLLARVQAGRPGGWIWIAPVLAWSLYAGFPETAYINGLFAGVWVLARGADLARAQWLPYVRGLLYGVGCGLLLSLPLIVPFWEMVGLSHVGGHDGAFAHAHLPLIAAAHSLMPWLFGSIFSYNDSAGLIHTVWGGTGGYLPALQVALALLGVWLAPRKLSFCLLGWMFLCLAKTFDWRPLSDLMNLIPLVATAAFPRYAPPSWEMAGAVLCALAIHAMQQAPTPIGKRRFAVTALAVLGVIAWLLVAAAQPLMEALLDHTRPRLGLIWLLLSFGLALAVFQVAKTPRALVKGLITLLIFDALLAFILPLGSGSRRLPPTGSGVAWLQSHAGLQRIYGMGPIEPNYGAYFKLAQINHNYLPIPNAWASFIHDRLDPEADSISFIGTDIHPPGRKQTASAALRDNLAAYEQLGVRYVVTAPGARPLDPAETSQPTPAPVYQGRDMDIYELPHPAPYFEASDARCQLTPTSRLALTLECPVATTLTRKEMHYPGWQARIDGQDTPITVHDGLFQSVQVPKGAHQIAFSYTPSHRPWWLGGFLAGAAILLFNLWREFSRRREQAQLASTPNNPGAHQNG